MAGDAKLGNMNCKQTDTTVLSLNTSDGLNNPGNPISESHPMQTLSRASQQMLMNEDSISHQFSVCTPFTDEPWGSQFSSESDQREVLSPWTLLPPLLPLRKQDAGNGQTERHCVDQTAPSPDVRDPPQPFSETPGSLTGQQKPLCEIQSPLTGHQGVFSETPAHLSDQHRTFSEPKPHLADLQAVFSLKPPSPADQQKGFCETPTSLANQPGILRETPAPLPNQEAVLGETVICVANQLGVFDELQTDHSVQDQQCSPDSALDMDEDVESTDGDYHADLHEDETPTVCPVQYPFYTPFCHYPLRVLSTRAREFLSRNLNQDLIIGYNGPKKNWEGLVHHIGWDIAYVYSIEHVADPCGHVLADWERQGFGSDNHSRGNIGMLLQYLERMERRDVLEDEKFWKLVDESVAIFNKEREKHAEETEPRHLSRLHRRSTLRGRRSQGAPDQTRLKFYDAYVCYDEADTEFIKELIYELEFVDKLSVCINARDLLVGDEHSVTAEIISLRCKRTLVVISENFSRSGNSLCDFAMKIAQSLNPSGSDTKLIPLRLDASEIPASLRHICHVDFHLCRERSWLWGRLSATLKLPVEELRLVELQKLRRLHLPGTGEDHTSAWTLDVRASMRQTAYKPPPPLVLSLSSTTSRSESSRSSSSDSVSRSDPRSHSESSSPADHRVTNRATRTSMVEAYRNRLLRWFGVGSPPSLLSSR